MLKNERFDIVQHLLRLLVFFLFSFFVTPDLASQSCDGADGIFPPLSGNTVLANGDICANSAVTPYRWQITYTNVDGVSVYKLSLRFEPGERSDRIGDVTLIR